MKQVPIKLGPLALLLTVISICLTTLAILTYSTARADMRLAEKYAETVRVRYTLEIQGQEYLRDLARESDRDGLEVLEDFGAPTDGTQRKTFEQDRTRLHVAVKPDGQGGYAVTQWKLERDWQQDTSIGNLWSGNLWNGA